MQPTQQRALTAALLATTLALAACGGGGGDGGSQPTPTPTPAPAGFSKTANWTIAIPATPNATVCYDFDTQAEVAGCTGNNWDLKLQAPAAGRNTPSFWSNGGVSGTGNGGVFGSPLDHTWTELATWKNGTTDPATGQAILPTLYAKDSPSSVFSGSNGIASAVFEYGVGGDNDHLLYPNFKVLVITTDSSKPASDLTVQTFALQLTGYYGGAAGTTSGYPSFRWIDRAAAATVRTAQVNASAGWVYFDLTANGGAGAVSSETGTWQIAFNRYNVKLNGGSSGSGTVAGFVGAQPAGFYTGTTPVVAKFQSTTNLNDTLADLQGTLSLPATAAAWVKDGLKSTLNPAGVMNGSYPNMTVNYGWYTYYASAAVASPVGLVAHQLKANTDQGSLLRSGEGDSYARVRLAQIQYADPTSATSAQTWTFQFDVQPRP